jgi:hypothetical protein
MHVNAWYRRLKVETGTQLESITRCVLVSSPSSPSNRICQSEVDTDSKAAAILSVHDDSFVLACP